MHHRCEQDQETQEGTKAHQHQTFALIEELLRRLPLSKRDVDLFDVLALMQRMEALALALVILSVGWVNHVLGVEDEQSDPVVRLGHRLSTCAGMDALGLDVFEPGARADLDLQVMPISMERIEAFASPVRSTCRPGRRVGSHRPHRSSPDLGCLESIDANGTLHSELVPSCGMRDGLLRSRRLRRSRPPRWAHDGAGSLLRQANEVTSRTGPDLSMTPIDETTNLLRACLPDSFTCIASTRPDVELEVHHGLEPDLTTVPAQTPPTDIEVDPDWDALSDAGVLGAWMDLEPRANATRLRCDLNGTEDVQVGAWDGEGDARVVLAPLATLLQATGLPSFDIAVGPGTWVIAEADGRRCIDRQPVGGTTHPPH